MSEAVETTEVIEEMTIPAYREVEKAKSPNPDCKTCDGTGSIKGGNVDCPDCVQDVEKSESLEAEIVEESIEIEDVEKGGPGSGENEGHPFRGNGHTSASFQAGAHNPRGDENMSGSSHLSLAKQSADAAQAHLRAGEYGHAMRQFNEAARHAAWAARSQTVGAEAHQQAKALYAAAHHAGDLAEVASKATNDAERINAQADPQGSSMAGMRAQIAQDAAQRASSTVQSLTAGAQSTASAGRMAN